MASPILSLPAFVLVGPCFVLIAWAAATIFWYRAMRLDARADPDRPRPPHRIITAGTALLAAMWWSLVAWIALMLLLLFGTWLFDRI